MSHTFAVNDKVEVKFFMKYGSQSAINVLHFNVSATGGVSLTDAALASEISAAAADLYQAWFTAEVNYLGCTVQQVAVNPQPVSQLSVTGAGVGAVAGDTLPPVVTLLLSKRTLLAGPSRRGRVYLPFWAESHSDVNGAPTAGAKTLAGDWADQFLDTNTYAVGANSVTLQPGVFSGTTAGFTALASYIIRQQWATQRRRSAINRGDSFGPF